MLEIEDLHAFYSRSHVVQGVSLRVEAGEGVGLVGHNGVGKTTTLKAIMGMGPRTAGRIAFAGRELRGPAHRRARLGLGFVPDAEAVFVVDRLTDERLRKTWRNTLRDWTVQAAAGLEKVTSGDSVPAVPAPSEARML